MKAYHWRKLKVVVDRVKIKARILCLEARPPKIEKFTVECRYNSRLDVDNVGSTCKIFIDQLVILKALPADDKRYWKGLSIIPDPEMKHNSLELKVIEVK